MIQENSVNNIDYYLPPTEDLPIFQNMNLIRIDEPNDFLLNGNTIAIDMQQQQQQQQVDISYSYPNCIANQHHSQQQFCNFIPVEEASVTPEENLPIDPNMSGISEASTVEGEINSTEEYPYLMGLNSNNLMQFSQQSVLMKMAEQEIDNSHILPLPTLDEHDAGGYNFHLNIPTQHNKAKSSWNYSDSLNKLYIRMNDIISIDANYTQKMPIQQLYIRMIICFVKEVSEPVLRCQNHMSKDSESNNENRQFLLRCENPNVEYCGSPEGKSIKDRFSVSMPASMKCNKPSDKTVKQTIALKFTCQNSCIGRKETCVIFLLEGTNGEILAQRLLNVRICSCPKRDKGHDEKNFGTKRKSEGADKFEPESKIRKREKISPNPLIIKDETSSSDYENFPKQFDIQRTASGGFRLIMELSTREVALHTIECAYARESVNTVSESKEAARSSYNFRKLRRLYNTCKDLN